MGEETNGRIVNTNEEERCSRFDASYFRETTVIATHCYTLAKSFWVFAECKKSYVLVQVI